MKIRHLVLLIVVLLLAPTLLFAQEQTAMRLTLQDCTALAIERNLEIAIARIAPVSSREGVTIAEAAFDPSLSGSLRHNETEQEPTSTFSSTSQSVEQAGVSYTDPTRYGGQWVAELGYRESDTSYPAGSAAVFGLVPLNVGASMTLSINQPLRRNFGLEINRTAIDQALNNLKISESQFQDQVMAIVEQVETAYWNLVGARQGLVVAQESLRLAKDFLRQTKIKVDVGTLPPIEITTAEAEVASRDESEIVQDNAVRNAEDVLRALIRVPPKSLDWSRPILPEDEPVYNASSIDVDAAIEEALARRSSVLETRLALKNQELNERWRRNQLRWDLRFDGAFTTSGNNFEYVPFSFLETVSGFDWVGPDGIDNNGDVFRTEATVPRETLVRQDGSRGDAFSELPNFDNTNWSVGLTLGIPLGNRVAKAEHARARAALDQAGLRVDAALQSVSVEVRRAVREVETTTRRVKAASANVVLQQKKQDAEQKRYENGLSTAFQVLQFQRDYLQAEANRISAVVDYMKALSHLERVKGTLLEARMIALD